MSATVKVFNEEGTELKCLGESFILTAAAVAYAIGITKDEPLTALVILQVEAGGPLAQQWYSEGGEK